MNYVALGPSLDETGQWHPQLDGQLVGDFRAAFRRGLETVDAVEAAGEITLTLDPAKLRRCLRVVVGKGVTGAAPEGSGPERYKGGPPLSIPLLDVNLLQISDPFRIVLDVGHDLEAPRWRAVDDHPLNGLVGHTSSLLPQWAPASHLLGPTASIGRRLTAVQS